MEQILLNPSKIQANQQFRLTNTGIGGKVDPVLILIQDSPVLTQTHSYEQPSSKNLLK